METRTNRMRSRARRAGYALSFRRCLPCGCVSLVSGRVCGASQLHGNVARQARCARRSCRASDTSSSAVRYRPDRSSLLAPFILLLRLARFVSQNRLTTCVSFANGQSGALMLFELASQQCIASYNAHQARSMSEFLETAITTKRQTLANRFSDRFGVLTRNCFVGAGAVVVAGVAA